MTLDQRDPSGGRTDLSRRGVLGLAASIPAVGVVGSAASASAAAPLALLGILAGHVLPATATMRAGSPADLAFISKAIEAGLVGARPEKLATLATALDRLTDRPFLSLSPANQLAALKKLDTAVFGAERRSGTGWEIIKPLILMSYYSSETGASKELAYAPIPGRFDPDLPVTPSTRALSNDWTGAGVRLQTRG